MAHCYVTDDSTFLESEVVRILDEGIIVSSASPWQTQAFTYRGGSKLRKVIDFSETINKLTEILSQIGVTPKALELKRLG